MIQNADDAGATSVKFLVDWRKGATDSLFSPGMAECQGPALWAYNNAVFTDEDFENINKLAGETKVEDISKIGRFGLGFNAVYHLTDVPSFISREYLVVFDPNTHHLQSLIRDRSRPGVRINLAQKQESLTRYQDQFQLYNDVFGCNTVQASSGFYYKGTLFRFPFRTASQARTSDISKTVYGQEKIQAIVSSLSECASTVLIFSQHVKEVELYELDKSSEPKRMRLVLSVKKPTAQAFGQQGVNNKEPFIKQCSKWWEQCRGSQVSCAVFPSGCELVNILTRKEPSKLSQCRRRQSSDVQWLVVSASGTDTSLTIARSPEGKARGFLPCGGVAFIVQNDSRQASAISGELFCFLPLSIPTGLPVHVNGYFAIMSNRVEIWKRTSMRSQDIEVEWNEALMEDALARAYIMLLEGMKELINKVQHYKFHSLWPSINTVDMHSWEKLVQKICSVLLDRKSKLFYSDGEWMNITDGFFLSDDFKEIYQTTVEVLRSIGIHVFNLPADILQTLERYDGTGIVQGRTLTFTTFMETYFFRNIKTFNRTQRDSIVCFGLDRILNKYSLSKQLEMNLFKRYACISVTNDGRILKKPCELIHPSGPASKLFSDQDQRFPVGNDLRSYNRLHVLETLGMVRDLDWDGIYERAQSIAKNPSVEHSRKLIEYMNNRIHQLPTSSSQYCILQTVKFLPVLKKPVNEYVLPWKGSSVYLSLRFCEPNNAFLPDQAELVGSSCFIVDTSNRTGCGELTANMKFLLGFLTRLPADNMVIQQLDEAIKFWSNLSEVGKRDATKKFAIESVCQKIYGFFNDKIVNHPRNRRFLSELAERKCWFLKGEFVESRKVAHTCSGEGAPFLFVLPSNYRRDYGHLFEAMEIKHQFNGEDYIHALYELENTKKGHALTDSELHTAVFFISEIDAEDSVVKNYIGNIPLPDTNCILRRSKDVVINLDLWIEDTNENVKVHEKISQHTAFALGARSLKSVIMKKHSHRIDYGVAFRQHEDLTVRLQGILEEYPANGILKELVQNADDAQASEIHFIYDTRTLASEKVATDEASEELQGPALCVYNDKSFTDKDLEGIKKLGAGGKRGNLEMTGRYGIGFNSVYHLTDCPSFLSNDDTLAFLDPNCRYFVDDDRGRLFKLASMNRNTLNNISDTLDGYLGKHFDLKGSTMFRFPLRRTSNESKVCRMCLNIEKLMQTFQEEARKSLLFLNHIKKITLSKIQKNGKFEQMYQVETAITAQDEGKRQEMAQEICKLSGTPTAEIGWKTVSYTLSVKENSEEVERWLVQRCIGSIVTKEKMNEIPDGRNLGLFPRGGLAARLWVRPNPPGIQKLFRGMAYCSLPLPENYTNLPVHVNGHFALDNSRRGLWTEADGRGKKCEWNHFMNTCVLPPTYAALIKEARNHLCNDEIDNRFSRYYALFPRHSSDSSWKILTSELYRYLGHTRAKVLPLLIPNETKREGITDLIKKIPGSGFLGGLLGITSSKTDETPQPVRFTRSDWLSADQAYFVITYEEADLLHLLVRIGLPVLLNAPGNIHSGFKYAKVPLNEVKQDSVINFLKEFESKKSTCKIVNLPNKLESTVVKNISELSTLLEYCCKDEDFGKQLEGLPLLLTQDGYLRVFDSDQPVFRSKFGDLFPTQSHLFVHSEMVYKIPSIATQSEENIVREFTVHDLANLLPYVFTDEVLRAIENDETWKFPEEGTLSIRWFKRFWNFLETYKKPEPNDNSVSLECLLQWPLIPATCGKLITIREGKIILDMTIREPESTEQENVRQFLSNLECLELDKGVICEDKTSFSVTDPYVAHPHNVTDIMMVLRHLLHTNQFDISLVTKEEIYYFLRFVQDNYQRSVDMEQCKQIIKSLPVHETLNGDYVSLIGRYSSYALVPSGIPMQQLDELQERSQCLFLSSKAFETLGKLYSDLGITASQNISEFYVEYVFRHFEMFTREGQIEHLKYIRDEIHLSFSKNDLKKKKKFLHTMNAIPCIPDQAGNLHFVQEFFDLNNKMFKIVFEGESDKFPPSPFNEEDWFDLLKDVGLQVDVTPELFLQFCKMVAEDGRRSPSDHTNRQRSEVLVKSLFSEEDLQDEQILTEISHIKFIAPAKVEEELTSIHTQYQCTENGHPPFLAFKDAVPWCFRDITWTTASILPIWAQPNNMNKFKNLRIASSGPTYTKVVDHLKNLVHSCSSTSVVSIRLHEIIKSIYQFLSKALQCSGSKPHDHCSDNCVDIGVQLKNVPCIFLPEDKTFVKAEQLVFTLPEDCPLKPFLYSVPRDFGDLEHFLKRLGASENPTPTQISYVLNSLYQEVGREVLSPDMENKIKYAMRILFELLYMGESGDGIDELYLLSQEKTLIKSSDMVCKVPPRLTELIEDLQLPILVRFDDCGLKRVDDDCIDALPLKLQPTKLGEIIREEVDSECMNSVCPNAESGSICEFQQQFYDLLRSDEFQEGLKRLLVEDRRNPRKFQERIMKLQSGVKTKCIGFQRINVNIINRRNNDVMHSLEQNCCAVQEDGAWSLYMQHEFKDDKRLLFLVTCVNEILGNCIRKEKGMIAMLGCLVPNEISRELDKLDITRSTTKASDDSSDSDDWDSDDEPDIHKGSSAVNRGRNGGSGGHSR